MRTVAAALCSLVAAWAAPAAGAPAADGPAEGGGPGDDATNSAPADSDAPDNDPTDSLVVEDVGGASAAPSARSWGAEALARAPGRSADELLRLVPGLHASAHGGRGKGFQYFLRGHDALHGGDLAVRLDGVPLNEPSNVHGHGYLDLHFIPEPLLAGMAAAPGASRAEVGDFAVAGSVDLALGAAAPGPGARARGGTDRSGGFSLWAGQPGGAGFAAAEVDAGQGVGEARSWRLARAGAGGARRLPRGGALRGWALAGATRFDSPGTLREDDVLSGRLDWTEAYPGSGGGESQRALAAVSATGRRGRATGGAQLWGGLRRLRLDQNFTGYLRAPQRGDATRQTHAANSLGLRVFGSAPLGARALLEGGADARLDQITQATQPLDADGALWGEALRRAGQVRDGALYAQARWAPTPALLLRPGLRAEGLALQADPDALDPDGAAQSGGALLPKLELAAWADRPLSAGLAAGRGLRSPALEGLGVGDRATIARVDTGELGLRYRPAAGLDLRLVGYGARASDELQLDPLVGRYVGVGPTRRLGAELSGALAGSGPLRLDGALGFTDARLTGAADPVGTSPSSTRPSGALLPYAPRLIGQAGAGVEGLPLGAGALSGGLRLLALGPRPLPAGLWSARRAQLDLRAAYRLRRVELAVDVDNLLGQAIHDGEFVFASDWRPHDGSASALAVRHVSFGPPRALSLSVSVLPPQPEP